MNEPYIDEELKNPAPIISPLTEAERLQNELLAIQVESEKRKLNNEKEIDQMINDFLGL